MSVTTINNLGHILGSGDTPDGETHFFLIDGNGLRDLGSLGRVSIYPIDITDKDSIQIAPVAMNDRDEIAGYLNEYGDPPTEDSNHVFLYKNGTFIDLGCPENGRCMVAGMNSNGHIIGSVTVDLGDDNYEHHAFLYADGHFQYLDALLSNGKGWSELRLTGINDADQMVGVGSFEGMGTGFVLQPIP
jgi:probable HAF family extracellular repeat protein